ncbi:MerR family transcriptional regulator [Carboxylicivirga mesophila]|uniref:MerR family transcriptional regulator n=1 Tax=Carboxylicivirga mesophila TaxID=1166478 RepID=A0ABS5K9C5_9BACT|nr:MerR family transcriptional regulator [Carboxylicivirga mesophila]MBS2211462.1 MerR family transcriptional regulator [Carboxylicivirga mesophila]
MAFYSIKDLEKISGIKAHTIRIWERRYNLIEPQRTSTNIRYYDDDDLKRILNVSILNQNGYKISKIADMTEEQLRERVIDLCLDTRNTDVQIESLLVAMLEMDESKFTNVLTNSIIKLGFEATVEVILFPFLDRIGILWQAGTINPAQEHFISNLIRQKLIVAIDNEMQNFIPKADKTIVFFLPENELHEIGLLFYSLIARKEGFSVIYLGASVPVEDLKVVFDVRKADAMFTSFVSAGKKEDIEAVMKGIEERVPAVTSFVTGLQVRELKPALPKQFEVITTAKDFKARLNAM